MTRSQKLLLARNALSTVVLLTWAFGYSPPEPALACFATMVFFDWLILTFASNEASAQ